MTYLNFEQLNSISPVTFQNAKPFPWINPRGFLTDWGFQRLVDHLPDISLFQGKFGYDRGNAQKSHDRYDLEYEKDLNVPQVWHEFIKELNGKHYRNWLNQLFDCRFLKLRFHWHYTPTKSPVSPHCDNKRKMGSHIFYLNTEKDWDQKWGGETLLLDDGGRFNANSAPEFEDFRSSISSDTLGNYSLLFQRRDNSWHGVRAVQCPENVYRKVFIVVITDGIFVWRQRSRRIFQRLF